MTVTAEQSKTREGGLMAVSAKGEVGARIPGLWVVSVRICSGGPTPRCKIGIVVYL